jgi:dTDP-4-amino-4,6-dideoxygalactose transaminase
MVEAVIAQKLAILGGPRAVTVPARERWEPPKEKIKEVVCRLIDEGAYSVAGVGISLEFERRFAEYIGVPYCIGFDHGTSALWAAYYAVGVGPGDEVLHPCYTWICSIAPAVHMGARPVFCEIDPERLVIDPVDMERRITPRTKAVSIVHLYGNVCDMDAIMSIARRHGIAVIEDCSHCHGAEWDGKKLGSIGDIGCFSMQGGPPFGKPIAGGEAGLAVTSNREYYERMLLFSQLNRVGLEQELTNPEYRAFAPTNFGLKFRPHPWAMAVGLVLMDSLDYRNERRRQYRQKIYDGLAGVPGVRPLKSYPKAKPAGFYGGMHLMYHPQELGGLPVERLIEALQAEGVDMHHRGYELTHRLKLFAEGYDIYGKGVGPLVGDYPGYPPGSLPVSEEAHRRILGMPVFIEEEPGYSDQVIAAFKKVTSHYRELL